MYNLVEIGILNAVTAGALAIVVLLVGRLLRRPAVIHALWVLILLKMVTPPLVEVPVGLRLERLASLTESDRDTLAVAPSRQRSLAIPVAGRSMVVAAGHDNPRPGKLAGSSQTAFPTATAASALIRNIFAPDRWRGWLGLTVPILMWFWLAGTVAWFVVQSWRICGFVRLTGNARLACAEVQQQAQQLGRAIGVRRAPQIWVLDATMSPILWAVGSRTRIIFPADLLERVDPAARATLLTHELAHYRRGDHWVRLLEFAVTGLFWWHPAVWIARREIEVSEEHCCDAWVVAQFPDQPRRYAEAILDTIDFLSEAPPRVIPTASGLGQAPFLRERIRLIMSGVAPKSMSGTTRLGILAAAAVLLPIGPQIFEGAIRHADATMAAARGDTPGSALVDGGLAGSGTADDETTAIGEASADGQLATAVTTTAAADSKDMTAAVPPQTQQVAWSITNSPDGRFQAVAKTNGGFFLRDTFQQRSHDLSQLQISSIAFVPHRDLLAAGSADTRVYLIDCASGDPVVSLSGHQAAIGSIDVSPDSRFVASGSRDGVVKLWDIEYEKEVANRIPVQSSGVHSVRFSSDGRLLAIAAGEWMTLQEGTVALWDLRGGVMARKITAPSPIGAVAFGVDELIVAEWSGRTTRWNLDAGTAVSASKVDKDMVSTAAFAADAQKMLLAAARGDEPVVAPVWFHRMDRDQDGQLAWHEFQGARGTFRKLDLDANDVVSWDEVTTLQ